MQQVPGEPPCLEIFKICEWLFVKLGWQQSRKWTNKQSTNWEWWTYRSQMSEKLSPKVQDTCHHVLTFTGPLQAQERERKSFCCRGQTEPKHIYQTSRKHILSKHLVIFLHCCPKPVVNFTSKIPLNKTPSGPGLGLCIAICSIKYPFECYINIPIRAWMKG